MAVWSTSLNWHLINCNTDESDSYISAAKSMVEVAAEQIMKSLSDLYNVLL
jgi:hypothetical protein